MAKAAAAVANSSSSPVKELRDLSAMDAFRSRSISVSEHAVRRLEKSPPGKSKNRKPNTSCFLHGMGDGLGSCHAGPWGSFGWFVDRGSWNGWCMLEEDLYVNHFSLFWAAFKMLFFFFLLCMQLLWKTS